MAEQLRLTPAQGRQLRRLLYAEAFSFDTSAGSYSTCVWKEEHGGRGTSPGSGAELICNPVILGALQRLGLTSSRTVREGKIGKVGMTVQHTRYWLTARGREEAEAQRAAIAGAAEA